jgi:nicotinate-nucleotide pyrophosphorylase (carboxylating)
MKDWSPETLQLLEIALREDLGTGDLGTAAAARDLSTGVAVPVGQRGRATIVARESGILAGSEVARWVFLRLDPALEVRLERADGASFAAGDVVLRVAGCVRSILPAERLALNFLQRLCGIATLTRRFVEAVRGTGALILDTRKTTPGWRELERQAVRAGGGVNHRRGLFDALLLKENHVRAAGGIEPAWRAAAECAESLRGRGGTGAGGCVDGPAFLEIEVRDQAELLRALDAGARWILLDNFSLPSLADAVRLARSRVPDVMLEASGGIRLDNVRRVAETGVDRISVGALTHSAPAIDLSLMLDEVEPAAERPVQGETQKS